MKFSVFQVSRQGGREINEDRMGYCYTRGSAVFLLADGMGGHPQGEVAAQLALQAVAGLFQKEAKPELDDVATFLTQAILVAHRQILRYSMERAMLDSPRTTLVVAVVQAGAISWTHCGDSRLYLMRQGELLLRTRDHSLIEQDLAKSPTSRQADQPNRNVLFTCLGGPTQPIFVVTGPVTLQQGDRVMLCSDGLWSMVPEHDLVAQLACKPVAVAVPDLVEKALHLGGRTGDNVTCLALEWETPNTFVSTQGSVSADIDTDTGTVSAHGYASTMRAGFLDAAHDDLDDASIERSIAEINEAIRRTAQRKAMLSNVKVS